MDITTAKDRLARTLRRLADRIDGGAEPEPAPRPAFADPYGVTTLLERAHELFSRAPRFADVVVGEGASAIARSAASLVRASEEGRSPAYLEELARHGLLFQADDLCAALKAEVAREAGPRGADP